MEPSCRSYRSLQESDELSNFVSTLSPFPGPTWTRQKMRQTFSRSMPELMSLTDPREEGNQQVSRFPAPDRICVVAARFLLTLLHQGRPSNWGVRPTQGRGDCLRCTLRGEIRSYATRGSVFLAFWWRAEHWRGMPARNSRTGVSRRS